MKHPIQKVHIDEKGTFRFMQNEIVNFMLEKLRSFGYDLNDLHLDCHKVDPDDWDQFNQLIGYSVSGIPLKNEKIHDVAQSLYDEKKDKLKGDDPNTIKESHYEEAYNNLKDALREPIAELYHIHPSDLE
jgi:protein-tyrosine-phosphatase